MTKLIDETGRIVEVGSGMVWKQLRYYSHILIEREDGEVVRLEHVVTDDFITPSIQAGATGTVLFANQSVPLLQQELRVPVKNVIAGFADARGYVPPKEPQKSVLPYVSLAVAAFGLLLFLVTRGSGHSIATGVISFVLMIAFGPMGFVFMNAAKKAEKFHAQVIERFERMGFKPQASVVYG